MCFNLESFPRSAEELEPYEKECIDLLEPFYANEYVNEEGRTFLKLIDTNTIQKGCQTLKTFISIKINELEVNHTMKMSAVENHLSSQMGSMGSMLSKRKLIDLKHQKKNLKRN